MGELDATIASLEAEELDVKREMKRHGESIRELEDRIDSLESDMRDQEEDVMQLTQALTDIEVISVFVLCS